MKKNIFIVLLLTFFLTGCFSTTVEETTETNETKETSPHLAPLEASLRSYDYEIDNLEEFQEGIVTIFENAGYSYSILSTDSDAAYSYIFAKEVEDYEVKFEIDFEELGDDKAKVVSLYSVYLSSPSEGDSISTWYITNNKEINDTGNIADISISYVYESKKHVNIIGMYEISSEEYFLEFYYDEDRNPEVGGFDPSILNDYDTETDEFEQMPILEKIMETYLTEYNQLFK